MNNVIQLRQDRFCNLSSLKELWEKRDVLQPQLLARGPPKKICVPDLWRQTAVRLPLMFPSQCSAQPGDPLPIDSLLLGVLEPGPLCFLFPEFVAYNAASGKVFYVSISFRFFSSHALTPTVSEKPQECTVHLLCNFGARHHLRAGRSSFFLCDQGYHLHEIQ